MFLHFVAVFCWLKVSVCCGKKNLRDFFGDGSRPWTPSVSSWVNVVRMEVGCMGWLGGGNSQIFGNFTPKFGGRWTHFDFILFFRWVVETTNQRNGKLGGGLYRWLWGSGVFLLFFYPSFLVFLLPFVGVCILNFDGWLFFLVFFVPRLHYSQNPKKVG